MKKLLVILLVVAMLIPMGLVANAEGTGEKKGFYLVNWSTVDGDYSNVYKMPYFWSNASQIKAGDANVTCADLGGSSIPVIAANVKAYFDKVPEGARFINFCMPHDAVHQLAEYCFAEKAAPLVSAWLEEFLKEYKSLGGRLDGLTVDIEYLYVYNNYIDDKFYSKDPLVYDKIVNHPAYKEKIRPQLVERGFKFYSPATKETPEIYGIRPNAGAEYATSRAIWNAVMKSYMGQVVTDCCAPLWDYYPNAVVSDYKVKNVKPWLKERSDTGSAGTTGGVYSTAGNSSNINFYSVRPGPTFFTTASSNEPAYYTIPGYTDAIYEHTPFNRFLYDMNIAMNTYLGSDNGDISWWFAHAYYGGHAFTPYYAESVFHTGLLDPQIYLGYILEQDCKTDGARDAEKYENALRIVNDCLKQLTDVAGYADRKPIYVDPTWNHHFVLTGMYAGGRNIFRISPDNTNMTVEEFRVKDAADPTFTIMGETVTFPQGKIIEDQDVFGIGTCGYWVETPKDVMPITTRVDDYQRVYAAFHENFEGYEAGTEFSFENALPKYVWENKKQGNGSAVIVADPAYANNKVLEVKGTYNMKNIKMPDNITAGDTYAKNQAWEVSFTLPADMADDAELILLNMIPEKKKAKDVGVKIAGGKVYYDQAGEYVELTGVTLTAGTKYTLIREMNFTKKDAFTSDYYIYGADGALVGKAKNVPTAEMEIPVYGIGLSTKNISGGAVYFDDYKLYPTKVTTDFYLYNAKTGIQYTEVDKAQEGDVAYRLSWLNATKSEKSYTLMAAYYDGDTKVSEEVVQEIKMAPGADYIMTGIVENKQEGKKLLVYLRDNNPAEEEENVPGGDDTNLPTDDTQKRDPMMIIIAAAAVVVIAVAVVVIVVVSKKKKVKTEGSTAEREKPTEE